SRYHALNPELFYWAHATFVDQVIYNTDTFIRRLSYEEKVQIFEESRVWYRLYAVSERGQPETYNDFLKYWDSMLERFVPTPTIMYATGYIRKGLPRPKKLHKIPLPLWKLLSAPLNSLISTVIVGTLPPQMRDVCQLDWDQKKEKRFQRFAATLRALNPLIHRLPLKARYSPWAAEAWKREGIDPRKPSTQAHKEGSYSANKRKVARRRALGTPPEGSGLKPVYGPALPSLAELLAFRRAPQKVFTQRRTTFGDITFLSTPNGKLVSPLSPTACQAVALNRDKTFAAEPAWGFLIGRFFRRGLLLMDFEEHRSHRLILQQAFTASHLKSYLGQMQPMIQRRVAELTDGNRVRLLHEFKKLTLDVALEVFLGLELSAEEADRINKAFVDCVSAGLALVRYDIPGTRWSHGVQGRKVLEEFMYDHLPAKRAQQTPDLFSTLCHVSSDEGHTFSDEDVVNHMIFLLMAAHDTSTITLTTMAYYLAQHSEWQDKARAQSQILPNQIDYDDLSQFTMLDSIMKESLRLNAPVPGLSREAIVDTDIDGYFVPKGTRIAVMAVANHYNGDLWTNPDQFDPERFSPDRAEDKSHPFAWMPFGGGAHKCIGLNFAHIEIKLIMHNLLLTHEWTVPPGYQWKLDYTTLPVPKDGLPVRLRQIPAPA
ncbi:MAG TPA: cytochrome P450, partial [Acidimicrobiales bacterium]